MGFPVVSDRTGGGYGYMPLYPRLATDFLHAALPLGLELRRVEEPERPWPLVDERGRDVHDETPAHVPGEPPSIWALHPFAPEATNAAWRGRRIVLVLDFRARASVVAPADAARD